MHDSYKKAMDSCTNLGGDPSWSYKGAKTCTFWAFVQTVCMTLRTRAFRVVNTLGLSPDGVPQGDTKLKHCVKLSSESVLKFTVKQTV